MIEVQHLGDFTKQLVLEFCTIVSEDAYYTTFVCVEMCDEASCDMVCAFVAQRNCPQVAGQHIHDGQSILVAG